MENIKSKYLELLTENDFQVIEYDDYISIGKFTTNGRDFSFDVTNSDSIDEIRHEIWDCYDNFDVCEETMLWLDSSGHGKNGAPYDMMDVYKDSEECESFISEAYQILDDLLNE